MGPTVARSRFNSFPDAPKPSTLKASFAHWSKFYLPLLFLTATVLNIFAPVQTASTGALAGFVFDISANPRVGQLTIRAMF